MDRRSSAVRRRVTAALSSFSPSFPFVSFQLPIQIAPLRILDNGNEESASSALVSVFIGTDRELIRGSSCTVVLLRIHPLSHRYFPFVSYQLPLQTALLGSIDDGDERKRVQCHGRCFIGLERERFDGASRVVVLLRICFPFLTFISF
jgi:hypothetical protein